MLKKSLQDLWPNDNKYATPTSVGEFVIYINSQLRKCGKEIRTGSNKHRILYSSQQEYNKVIQLVIYYYY